MIRGRPDLRPALVLLPGPDRIGPLLCVTGFRTPGPTVGDVTGPVVAGVGFLLAESLIAALLHRTPAFPPGRLRVRFARALVVAGYAITVGFPITMLLLDPADRPFHDNLQSVTGSVVLVLAAVLVLRRVGAAPARTRERRVRAAGSGYGVVTLLFLPFSARLPAPLLDLSATGLFVAQLAVFVWIPVVFEICDDGVGGARPAPVCAGWPTARTRSAGR